MLQIGEDKDALLQIGEDKDALLKIKEDDRCEAPTRLLIAQSSSTWPILSTLDLIDDLIAKIQG